MIRVFLADDHAVLRAGLKALLSTQPDITTVGEASDAEEAVRLAAEVQPDVVLLDVTMPGNERLAALRALSALPAAPRVILLTMHQDEEILREALRLGAAGYVLKKAVEADLLTAIRAVARGEAYIDPAMTATMIRSYLHPGASPPRAPDANGLSPREVEILTLVAQGYANREIAEKLFISVKTVETHKAHISEKLGLRSRVDLVRYARARGLLSGRE
jgi:two-component system response regulator NreC